MKKQPTKSESWLIRLIKAPFRLHDFDLENVQCINEGSLDKEVTLNPQGILYFVAFCNNCGAPVQVSRGTFIAKGLPWRKRWFCRHDSTAYKLHLEHVRERMAELTQMTVDDYKRVEEQLNYTDKRVKNPHEKP